MRVSREKFAENRERILDAAARLFRAGVTAGMHAQLDLLAPLIGTVTLARISDDPQLADELLEAGRAALARSKT